MERRVFIRIPNQILPAGFLFVSPRQNRNAVKMPLADPAMGRYWTKILTNSVRGGVIRLHIMIAPIVMEAMDMLIMAYWVVVLLSLILN